ncbi:MAG: tetraacyldisaccharide 4'-kinase, partial [Sphingobacterium sp.]
ALSERDREQAIEKLGLKKNNPIFFSCISYASPVALSASVQTYDGADKKKIIAISGIANPTPFLEYLKGIGELIDSIIFPDHHQFSNKDIRNIVKIWKRVHQEALLITTEKEAMRLQQPDLLPLLEELPLYYIPIHTVFHQDDEKRFNELINSKVSNILQNNDKTIKKN